MATSKKANDAGSEDIPAKGKISIFEKYRTFLEEHFSREDHNSRNVVTRGLTIKTTGTFDYVSIKWTIHSDNLKEDYPELVNKWTLYGIRRFSDFTKLDGFPGVVDGEVFLKTAQPSDKHSEYLKADSSANFAFFLVAKYPWSTRKKILGPLTVSLTPLRGNTKEMWKELADILNVPSASPVNNESEYAKKKALLAKLVEEEKEIDARIDLNQDQKEHFLERTRALYNIFERAE